MKFSEIVEPSGGYVNNTTSWFLVLGIAEIPIPSRPSQGVTTNTAGNLYDPNGNLLDYFIFVLTQILPFTGNMTVWNGTSMESEPYTGSTQAMIVSRKTHLLIPPGYSFDTFSYAIGFWLTEEEVEQYILHGAIEKEKIQIASDNIIGPAIEEKTTNQSQKQNPNYIGKYLIGGPRW